MIQSAIQKLEAICNTIPEKLKAISETDLLFKSSPEKWSKKQILGHLIDSATNNHQRFVRVQFEIEPTIFYNQNKWVEVHNYELLDTKQLISFWESYNRQLIHILKLIPEDRLNRKSTDHSGQLVTMKFQINDYVAHMEHHLKELVG